ncbi:MAG: hypothetical protein JO202_16750 [Ktedonobacteraceae bacterium]|nr:hypothetical protein [Ktedonobacteraceae bacterium]
MIHTKDKQAEREELQQATRYFIRSLVRTGESVALLPITRLPRELRQHFLAAGREFTCGWAALVREFASGIEELAKETGTSTSDGEDAHAPGAAGESQETWSGVQKL